RAPRRSRGRRRGSLPSPARRRPAAPCASISTGMVPPQGEKPWCSCSKHPRARQMDPATLFRIASLLPLPIWAVWIVAPHTVAAPALARRPWPWAILATLYTGLVGFALLRHGLDPQAFASLAGVMKLFASPWVALAGWVHYLCFDLFVARWMLHDAP